MAIMYKYISQKVLEFTSTEGVRSTEQGVLYLSCFYYGVSIFPVFCHHITGRNYSKFNSIDNHKRARQSGVALEKYWETQSVYFRLETTVALGIGITDGKLLF